MRRISLVFLALGCVASDCRSTQLGPSKYSDTLVSLTPDVGRMCSDPAGAPISVEAVYTVTCVDEDLCGGDLGEEYTVTYAIDAGSDNDAVIEETVLENGDPIGLDDSCMQFTGELQALDPVEGEYRDVGGLAPDCTVQMDGPQAVGLTAYRLVLDHIEGGRLEVDCETDSAYAGPQLLTLEARGTDFCAGGATIDLGGTGQTECGESSTCTPDDVVTFDYGLVPYGEFGSYPEVSLSDGGTQHLPYHCHDALVQLKGMDGNTERTVGDAQDCLLVVDEDTLAEVTDLWLEGHVVGQPDATFSQACP